MVQPTSPAWRVKCELETTGQDCLDGLTLNTGEWIEVNGLAGPVSTKAGQLSYFNNL